MAKPGRSTITIVGKERADRIRQDEPPQKQSS
jgi:hypothetical protein